MAPPQGLVVLHSDIKRNDYTIFSRIAALKGTIFSIEHHLMWRFKLFKSRPFGNKLPCPKET